MSNASNLSTLANVLDDGTSGQFLKSTGSGGVAFDTVAAGAVVYATADLLPLSGNSAGDMAYVTATNRFYINNGSGWYSVSLVNTNPNITSVQDAGSNTTPFTLATDGTATVITVTAADPEEVPLTYDYSVTSGSLNGSTVTKGTGNNSNVFTVTPHASQDATFTITFTASDGINQATSANVFSLSFVTVVDDSNHTTLLATATGTSDNNDITDSSSNSYSVTVNDHAYAGTFSPYRSGGYSTYFDGSGDRIYFVDSSLAEGTDDFTLECWFYLTENLQSNHTIFGHGATPGYQICGGPVNQVGFMKDGSNRLLQTATLNLNQWYHIVYQRASGTLYGFLDGVSLGTISMTNNFTNTSIEVGVNRGGTEYFEGYIRDVRIVKGTTIYNTTETTFTPPTETLTAVSGSGYSTTLLTCHKPYIVDGGANSLEPAIYGDVSTKPFSPYDYNEYSATDHGGSVYFDGSGDYLGLSDNSSFDLPSEFAWECWIYRKGDGSGGSGTYQAILGGNGSSSNGFTLYITQATGALSVFQSSFIITGSANDILDNQWSHILLMRDSSNLLQLFINGTRVSSSTNTTSFTDNSSGSGLRIGYDINANAAFNGYISDVRLFKGSTGGYSSGTSITVPTAPLSSTGAELHLKGTDASIIDKSQVANLKLVGNTTGSTTQAKFSNTKSMYFDGSGDYIVISKDTTNINTLDKDFTIEFWLYDSSPTTWKYVAAKSDNTGNTSSSEISFGTGKFTAQTDGKLYYSNNLGAYLAYTNSALSANTWYHIAVVRNNNVFTMYLDGVAQTATTTNAGSVAEIDEDLVLGGHQYQISTLSRLNGYIQDFRITNGLARYTANFTPPSAPLEG